MKRTEKTAGDQYAHLINTTGNRPSWVAKHLGMSPQTVLAGLKTSGYKVYCVALKEPPNGKPGKARSGKPIPPEEALRRSLVIEERAHILVRLMRGEIHQREAAKLAGVSRRTITAWLIPSGSKARKRALELLEKQNTASP